MIGPNRGRHSIGISVSRLCPTMIERLTVTQ